MARKFEGNPNLSPEEAIDLIEEKKGQLSVTKNKGGRPKELKGEIYKQTVAVPQLLKNQIDQYMRRHNALIGGSVSFAALVRDALESYLPVVEEKLDAIEQIDKKNKL